jgi:hypothetical protein
LAGRLRRGELAALEMDVTIPLPAKLAPAGATRFLKLPTFAPPLW